jgi:hypothetical protein
MSAEEKPETFRYPWSYPELFALSFLAEDATIHEVLYAMLQGFGQRCDHQRGDDHTQPGFLLLGYGKEEFLCHLVNDHEYAREHHRESTVDEGTVYEEIYVVEVVLEDGDGDGRVKAYQDDVAKQTVQRLGHEEAKKRVYASEGRGVGKPLQLLTLLEAGAAIPGHEREHRENNGAVEDQLSTDEEDTNRLSECAPYAKGILVLTSWVG